MDTKEIPAHNTNDTSSPQAAGREDQLICYACGASVPAAEERCPECGRRQWRTCFCGARIPVAARRCPECGADWSQSVRVRRKSKSRHLRPRALVAHAAIGGLGALLLVALVDVLVTVLAAQSLASDEAMPSSFGLKLELVAATLWSWTEQLAQAVYGHTGALVTILVVVGVGAGAGALYYLYQAGILRMLAASDSKRNKRRRK